MFDMMNWGTAIFQVLTFVVLFGLGGLVVTFLISGIRYFNRKQS
ncbi:hypothetical protein ACE1TH_16365 [Shouchella sp. JSM 1781072]|nr:MULTISPECIES: hypothetical protein [Bacillaceae]